MRKFKWIIILSILMVFSSISVFAQGGDIIQVIMNGEKVDVRRVSVLLDGQALDSEVPSFIHIDRTLVPVRFVVESFGAEVSWDQKTKTATILNEDNIVKLTIDSPMADLNGEIKILDKNSIPRLVSLDGDIAWTMVPLAFISEVLGYEVGYDDVLKTPYINSKGYIDEPVVKPEEPTKEPDNTPTELSTITNISITKGSTNKSKVSINSNNMIKYETKVLSDTNKLVIDIKNAVLDIKGSGDKPVSKTIEDDNFTKLEYSQYSKEPNIVRVVITMTDILDYDIIESQDKKTNTISFVNKISDFRIENVNNKELILIEGNKNIEYKVLRLNNPERIVIDIMDASLSSGTYYEFGYELGIIKGIRVSQFQADNNYSPIDRIVRVVIDIKDGVLTPLVKIDNMDDNLLIYPQKDLWENISFELDGKDRILTIDNTKMTDYQVDNLSERKTLEIRIPSYLSDLEEGHVYIKDGLIEDIEIIRDLDDILIQIRYNKSILFETLSKEKDKIIKLKINRNLDIKPSDRLIVIDAGHGGTDPGASSITGKKEKELTFGVSNKLRKALEEKGYNILMTRDTDVFVDLYERARIANDSNADIFISIHGNSVAGNKNVNGMEVYYWPQGKSEIKTEEQYPLANYVYTEMINATGAGKRGVKTNGYVVIKYTKMPAILIETGFLTNPAEEKLLYSDEYQNKMVQGMVKGIESYFEMY